MKKRIVIGITDCSRYQNYEDWLKNEPHVTVRRLSYGLNNASDVEQCDGILLSGGEDVHPRFYNREEYTIYCHEIDERRDEFEWKVLEHAGTHRLPLLGICRGLQMANVYFGGTLIPDLPSFGRFNHSKFEDRDRSHSVSVDTNSALFRITTETNGRINSAHHQSADLIGKGLVANCLSSDGVVEGIERIRPDDGPFLMLVQWHPERMTDTDNPLSKKVKLAFIQAVNNHVNSLS